MNFSGNEYQGGTISGLGVGGRVTAPNGSYIYQDDLTWIHGKHSFRFGYEYKRYFSNAKLLSDAGVFRFFARSTDLPGYLDETGHDFASFLLGAADSATHGVNILSAAFRQPQHGFYVMDDWKVTPKLTVNGGLRWEVIPPSTRPPAACPKSTSMRPIPARATGLAPWFSRATAAGSITRIGRSSVLASAWRIK
jgi:outer membrane receptor protein involved in Fe transport